MRAGAVVTTREARNGRFAKMMLRVDPELYQCRYVGYCGLFKTDIRDRMLVMSTKVLKIRRRYERDCENHHENYVWNVERECEGRMGLESHALRVAR
jgi:hypothetical protein